MLFALVAVLATGCSPPPPPPLRIATDTRLSYEPFYVARQMGRYNRHDIHLVELTTTSDVLRALRDGLVDGATITLDELLLLRAEGIDVRAVLVLDVSDGADALVARPAIANLDALRGRRVGYENNTAGAVLLAHALEAASLRSKDIVPVPIAADEELKDYRSGLVDGVVTYAPLTGQFLRQGAHVVYDSRAVSGQIVDVLAVRGAIAARRGGALHELIDGWFDAVKTIRQRPAAAAPVIARRTGYGRGHVMRRFASLHFLDVRQNRLQLLGPAPGLLPTARELVRLMMRHHLVSRAPALTGLIEPRPLEGL